MKRGYLVGRSFGGVQQAVEAAQDVVFVHLFVDFDEVEDEADALSVVDFDGELLVVGVVAGRGFFEPGTLRGSVVEVFVFDGPLQLREHVFEEQSGASEGERAGAGLGDEAGVDVEEVCLHAQLVEDGLHGVDHLVVALGLVDQREQLAEDGLVRDRRLFVVHFDEQRDEDELGHACVLDGEDGERLEQVGVLDLDVGQLALSVLAESPHVGVRGLFFLDARERLGVGLFDLDAELVDDSDFVLVCLRDLVEAQLVLSDEVADVLFVLDVFSGSVSFGGEVVVQGADAELGVDRVELEAVVDDRYGFLHVQRRLLFVRLGVACVLDFGLEDFLAVFAHERAAGDAVEGLLGFVLGLQVGAGQGETERDERLGHLAGDVDAFGEVEQSAGDVAFDGPVEDERVFERGVFGEREREDHERGGGEPVVFELDAVEVFEDEGEHALLGLADPFVAVEEVDELPAQGVVLAGESDDHVAFAGGEDIWGVCVVLVQQDDELEERTHVFRAQQLQRVLADAHHAGLQEGPHRGRLELRGLGDQQQELAEVEGVAVSQDLVQVRLQRQGQLGGHLFELLGLLEAPRVDRPQGVEDVPALLARGLDDVAGELDEDLLFLRELGVDLAHLADVRVEVLRVLRDHRFDLSEHLLFDRFVLLVREGQSAAEVVQVEACEAEGGRTEDFLLGAHVGEDGFEQLVVQRDEGASSFDVHGDRRREQTGILREGHGLLAVDRWLAEASCQAGRAVRPGDDCFGLVDGAELDAFVDGCFEHADAGYPPEHRSVRQVRDCLLPRVSVGCFGRRLLLFEDQQVQQEAGVDQQDLLHEDAELLEDVDVEQQGRFGFVCEFLHEVSGRLEAESFEQHEAAVDLELGVVCVPHEQRGAGVSEEVVQTRASGVFGSEVLKEEAVEVFLERLEDFRAVEEDAEQHDSAVQAGVVQEHLVEQLHPQRHLICRSFVFGEVFFEVVDESQPGLHDGVLVHDVHFQLFFSTVSLDVHVAAGIGWFLAVEQVDQLLALAEGVFEAFGVQPAARECLGEERVRSEASDELADASSGRQVLHRVGLVVVFEVLRGEVGGDREVEGGRGVHEVVQQQLVFARV